MIKVQNNIASREPIPSWMPNNAAALADTSWVTDPTLSAMLDGAVWWPEIDQTPELTVTQTYDGTETLTVGDGVVNVVRGIRDLTPEELRGSIPSSCTPAQGLVALFAVKGITEDDILAAIGQIADPVQQYTARIGLQRATSWERTSPTMQAMAALLGLTEQDLDDLYTLAVTVVV